MGSTSNIGVEKMASTQESKENGVTSRPEGEVESVVAQKGRLGWCAYNQCSSR